MAPPGKATKRHLSACRLVGPQSVTFWFARTISRRATSCHFSPTYVRATKRHICREYPSLDMASSACGPRNVTFGAGICRVGPSNVTFAPSATAPYPDQAPAHSPINVLFEAGQCHVGPSGVTLAPTLLQATRRFDRRKTGARATKRHLCQVVVRQFGPLRVTLQSLGPLLFGPHSVTNGRKRLI